MCARLMLTIVVNLKYLYTVNSERLALAFLEGNPMKISVKALLAGGMLLSAMTVANADTYTLDFTSMPLYTPVTSGPGPLTSIFLYGGPGDGIAVTGSFGTASLGNSPTGDYPTSEGILFSFSAPVRNVSFTFDNFGDNGEFGPSYYSTDAGGFGYINGYSDAFSLVSVNGGDLQSLFVDNGTGGSGSWEFGIGSITYTSAPEPSTWAMMGLGFAGLAFAGYRARKSVAIAA